MRAFSTLALLALPLFGAAVQPSSISSSAHETFQDLLNALPESSLQAALSSLKDFKTGVFESHHRGVEQVHDKNPALATQLIVAAAQDLKKRQAPSNGTSIASPPPAQNSPSSPPPDTPATSTPAAPPTPSADPTVLVPIPQTTTNAQGQTIVATSTLLSLATASAPVVIRTLTLSDGRLTTSTSPLPTPGEVRTETDAQGSAFVTTYTPPGGRVRSTKLVTTTGEDGRVGVVTSYEYVDSMATPTGVGAGASRTAGKPGLQTGAAARGVGMGYAVVGGAVALFV